MPSYISLSLDDGTDVECLSRPFASRRYCCCCFVFMRPGKTANNGCCCHTHTAGHRHAFWRTAKYSCNFVNNSWLLLNRHTYSYACTSVHGSAERSEHAMWTIVFAHMHTMHCHSFLFHFVFMVLNLLLASDCHSRQSFISNAHSKHSVRDYKYDVIHKYGILCVRFDRDPIQSTSRDHLQHCIVHMTFQFLPVSQHSLIIFAVLNDHWMSGTSQLIAGAE